jgi:hypothetical protein
MCAGGEEGKVRRGGEGCAGNWWRCEGVWFDGVRELMCRVEERLLIDCVVLCCVVLCYLFFEHSWLEWRNVIVNGLLLHRDVD